MYEFFFHIPQTVSFEIPQGIQRQRILRENDTKWMRVRDKYFLSFIQYKYTPVICNRSFHRNKILQNNYCNKQE